MIRDAASSEWAPEGRYDCCVVGSGPAGLTIAMKLAEAGRRVIVLEGGGFEPTPESEEIYEGEILGQDYWPLVAPRLRYLGGTSGHWGGQCLQFDDFDFEPRDDVPLSGWPIRHGDVAPYADGASEILNCRTFGEIRKPADDTGNLDVVDQRWSSDRAFYEVRSNEPVRFGRTYRSRMETTPGLDVVVNANLVGFEVDGATGRVTRARVASWDGTRPPVEADRFVLAMGAIENARYLLHLNAEQGDRFGNQGGMVGRCFMEHPVIRHGIYFVAKRLYSHSETWEFERLWRRATPELLLSPSRSFALANGLLNATLRLNRLNNRPLTERELGDAEFVRNLIHDEDYFHVGTTWVVGAQAPDPTSRLVLIDPTDRFGLRRIGLDWRINEIDIRTLRETTLEAGRFLIRSGLGRMQMDPALWEQAADLPFDFSSHHMGGTRMAQGPETGVVDADSKVFGSENLYVAGSSVFATAGHANPTFTIVQLALRLADHLNAAAA